MGVLALQGDFEAHGALLRRARRARCARCATRGDLDGVDALVLPGGESTTMTLGIEREGLARAAARALRAGAGARDLRRA